MLQLNDKITKGSYERIIVLSPHLDDAVFSCGGMLSIYSRNHRLLVVSAASADFTPQEGFSSAELTSLLARWGTPASRRAEDHLAMSRLSLSYAHLGFFDAIFRTDDHGHLLYQSTQEITSAPASADKAHRERLTATIKALTTGIGKTLVFAPLGLGFHVDHGIMAAIGCELMTANQNVEFLFYEDFPYTLLEEGDRTTITLEGNTDSHDAASRRLGMAIDAVYTLAYDKSAKQALIECYQSQVNTIFGGSAGLVQLMVSLAEKRGFFERYFRLKPV